VTGENHSPDDCQQQSRRVYHGSAEMVIELMVIGYVAFCEIMVTEKSALLIYLIQKYLLKLNIM
jgi:hypothetical protein